MTDFHVIVVGTGAAGLSAAFPLAERGLKVLLIDPDLGHEAPQLPAGPYLDNRFNSYAQWHWFHGRPSPATSSGLEATSPKFRVPTLRHVFDGYAQALDISTENFETIGSLASGGLTNAWGAGVAKFTFEELKSFPTDARDLSESYRSVSRRIGISGGVNDDLAPHFGDIDQIQHPHDLEPLANFLARRYQRHRTRLTNAGFSLGRARLAVLTEHSDERVVCNQSGTCLWGCKRGAIYSAKRDLEALKSTPNVEHASKLLVESVSQSKSGWHANVLNRISGARSSISASRIVLAAGTISSSKLALALAGQFETPIRMLSNPTMAFALFFPAFLGSSSVQGASLAHHAFALQTPQAADVSGFLFPTLGIPMLEFAARTPLGLRTSIGILSRLLPSMMIGNVFFDGKLSEHQLVLTRTETLRIKGAFHDDFERQRQIVSRKLRSTFRSLGSISMPGSFAVGNPGSDVHYAGTFPMKDVPGPLNTSSVGELYGFRGLHLVDGSILPVLPGKPHTFTIMANAARIGQRVSLLVT